MGLDLDLVGKLTPEKQAVLKFRMQCVSPDEGKYGEDADSLRPYLSEDAEWRGCAFVQKILIETRAEFGQATPQQVKEVEEALSRFDPANASLLEKRVTHHDQLAVLAELGRYVPVSTLALLHPGTTSYDPLDTVRSYLLKKAWVEVMLPEIKKSVAGTLDFAGRTGDLLQVGRTHLQNTSPVLLSGVFAAYAARMAERAERCKEAFGRLKGKISGIVGTGASVDMIVGLGKSIEFERRVLEKLGLEPDYTASQIVQKEALADVGNQLSTFSLVAADFANAVRMMYASAIGEVYSLDTSKRLGGSSADAAKDNPINWENVAGKTAVIVGGIGVLYAMITSDFQRDLRGSVQARYQPRIMMTELFESLRRLNWALPQLQANKHKLEENLIPVRKNPSEAMVAILRGEGWTHSTYGVGHDFVKEMSKKVKATGRPLLDVAREDPEFNRLYEGIDPVKQQVLQGNFEGYMESARTRRDINVKNATEALERL